MARSAFWGGVAAPLGDRGREPYAVGVRASRVVVVLLAVVAGAAVVSVSDRPVQRTVVYEPRVDVGGGVLDELARVRAVLEDQGATVQERAVEASERTVVLTGEAPIGGCVSVIAAAHGRWRIDAVQWWPYGQPAPSADATRTTPFERVVAGEVCPLRQSRSARTVRFQATVVREGPGGATLLLADRRAPPIEAAPIDGDRVVIEEQDWRLALTKGAAVAMFLLLFGLMAEGALRTHRETADVLRSLRRLSIALPAGLEHELAGLVSDAPSSPRAARALRDRLVELAPHAVAATYARWRTEAATIDAQHAELRRSLQARAAESRGSGYRDRERGLVVLTLLVRHRCELPEMPGAITIESLRLALESSIPRDDAELVSVDVILQPRDRADVLDPAQLARLFPELVRLGASSQPCVRCEAPMVGVTCASCGATRADAPIAAAA